MELAITGPPVSNSWGTLGAQVSRKGASVGAALEAGEVFAAVAF